MNSHSMTRIMTNIGDAGLISREGGVMKTQWIFLDAFFVDFFLTDTNMRCAWACIVHKLCLPQKGKIRGEVENSYAQATKGIMYALFY